MPASNYPIEVTLPGTDLRVQVEYDYEPYEAPVYYPPDSAYPGADESVSATAVLVRSEGLDMDILDALSEDTVERLEEAVLDELRREPDWG